MSSMYMPNVILGALDAIGPEPLGSAGLMAYYNWQDARRRAIGIITLMDNAKWGFISVPDQAPEVEAVA